jgi:predicted transcriptional regulator
MSRTVSFRCSEELDELLEQEAEERMTTKSTVAQMIVAQHFKNRESETEENDESEASPETESDASETDTSGEHGGQGDLSEWERILENYSDKWYKPDGQKSEYAVNAPNGDHSDRMYYKSAEGAAKRVKEWYE